MSLTFSRVSWLVFAGVLVSTHSYAAGPSGKVCAARAEEAQAERKSAHLMRTREALISCADDACPKFIRVDCVRWLAEVESEIPSLVVQATSASGTELTQAAIFLDGAPVEQSSAGTAIRVDPGKHTLRVEFEGDSASQEVIAHVGEHNRAVRIALAARTSEKPREGEVNPILSPPKLIESSGGSAVPWVLGGVGIAAVATGGVLSFLGWQQRGDLSSSCAPSKSCQQGDVDASKSKLLVGDITMVGGAVVLAVAIVLKLTESTSSKKEAARGTYLISF